MKLLLIVGVLSVLGAQALPLRASSIEFAPASIPAVKLPFTVGGTDAAGDLFGLFDDTVARLLAAGVRK